MWKGYARNQNSDTVRAASISHILDRLQSNAPWHFLYFFPLPQGHGSLRPTFCPTTTGWALPGGGGALAPLRCDMNPKPSED